MYLLAHCRQALELRPLPTTAGMRRPGGIPGVKDNKGKLMMMRPKGRNRSRRWFSSGRRRRLAVPLIAAIAVTPIGGSLTAAAHAPTDTLHGGQGTGVKVVGHTDLGGGGLNAHVAVLGDYAYVGGGTNGGFASQWNKTPQCATGAGPAATVKVVSLVDPANPTVVATITPGVPGAENATVARDVAAIHVGGAAPYDLLAVALESCNARDEGLVGINLYNVSNPAQPILLGHDDRFVGNVATRGISLVQRADGRVFAVEANQGSQGGVHVVDVTNPATPVTLGSKPTSSFPVVSNPPMECRPFSYAQTVKTNQAGTRAYAGWGDEGLLALDISNPDPTTPLPVVSQTKYPVTEEGNSFSFVPNAAETRALATDEDVLPAKTSITVSSGSASLVTEPGGSTSGVFRGCEAIWGSPLYKRATPSITAPVVFVPEGGCQSSQYVGIDVADKLVLVDRGGSKEGGGVCGFEDKARTAQDPNRDGDLSDGGAAVLIANTGFDHHGQGTNFLFSPDSVSPGDAGITIPVVNMTREARDALRDAIATDGSVTATLADAADTWGALRILDLTGAAPSQASVFNAPGTTALTSGEGLYHAVNALWADNQALVAWMSDGLRVVDATTPTAPKARAWYVPPAAADPTQNYGTVPLVVDVDRHGSRVVISDINGGLYVLNVILDKEQCKDGGYTEFGFSTQGDCVMLFDDDAL